MKRLLTNMKTAPKLINMGIKHGEAFDCCRDTCAVCQPYRDKEVGEVIMRIAKGKEPFDESYGGCK